MLADQSGYPGPAAWLLTKQKQKVSTDQNRLAKALGNTILTLEMLSSQLHLLRASGQNGKRTFVCLKDGNKRSIQILITTINLNPGPAHSFQDLLLLKDWGGKKV